MNKSSRLLYQITLILNNPGISIARLAQKCGVSERTIYRDLNDIASANFPIYFENGYRILDTGRVPPLNFTREEVLLLYGLLQCAVRSSALGATANGLVEKLRRFQPALADKSSFSFRPQSTDPPTIQRYFGRLEKAIVKQLVILIRYLSLNGHETVRHVHPYGMAFLNHGWYMVGYCEYRRDVRVFRLARILRMTQTRRQFTKPTDFSLRDFLDESWGVFRGPQKQFKVKLTGPAAVAVRTTRHHESERIENVDDGVIYTATVRGETEFINWVLSFGEHAELLEPPETRAEIRKLLSRLLRLYI